MPQQINLFKRQAEQPKGPLLTTLAISALVVVVLLAYWQYLNTGNDTLATRLAQLEGQLKIEQAAVQAMKEVLAKRMDPKRVQAELAALRTQAAEAEDIMDRYRRGDLGSIEGYGGHLITLARIGEPGLWLTGVHIKQAGRIVEMEGRSLQAETVLRYAGNVNAHLAGYGATINALELTPIVTTTAVAAPALSFRLF